MTLLNEGDSMNFQRASCTLDGCVKVYESHIDSVTIEIGNFLSGLAVSNDEDDEMLILKNALVKRI